MTATNVIAKASDRLLELELNHSLTFNIQRKNGSIWIGVSRDKITKTPLTLEQITVELKKAFGGKNIFVYWNIYLDAIEQFKAFVDSDAEVHLRKGKTGGKVRERIRQAKHQLRQGKLTHKQALLLLIDIGLINYFEFSS